MNITETNKNKSSLNTCITSNVSTTESYTDLTSNCCVKLCWQISFQSPIYLDKTSSPYHDLFITNLFTGLPLQKLQRPAFFKRGSTFGSIRKLFLPNSTGFGEEDFKVGNNNQNHPKLLTEMCGVKMKANDGDCRWNTSPPKLGYTTPAHLELFKGDYGLHLKWCFFFPKCTDFNLTKVDRMSKNTDNQVLTNRDLFAIVWWHTHRLVGPNVALPAGFQDLIVLMKILEWRDLSNKCLFYSACLCLNLLSPSEIVFRKHTSFKNKKKTLKYKSNRSCPQDEKSTVPETIPPK